MGSTRAGINMDAAFKMAGIIKQAAEATKDNSALRRQIGCVLQRRRRQPLHGWRIPRLGCEADGSQRWRFWAWRCEQRPTQHAQRCRYDPPSQKAIKATAFKITSRRRTYEPRSQSTPGRAKGILDLSLAPTPAEGDSVAEILEAIGVGQCGGLGTTAALAMLNDAVKKGGVMASSSVGGLSGAFIPVSEDAGMIRAAESGALRLEKL